MTHLPTITVPHTATGNWRGFRQAEVDCASWDLVQACTANAVNEITVFNHNLALQPVHRKPAFHNNRAAA